MIELFTPWSQLLYPVHSLVLMTCIELNWERLDWISVSSQTMQTNLQPRIGGDQDFRKEPGQIGIA